MCQSCLAVVFFHAKMMSCGCNHFSISTGKYEWKQQGLRTFQAGYYWCKTLHIYNPQEGELGQLSGSDSDEQSENDECNQKFTDNVHAENTNWHVNLIIYR